MMYIDNEFGPRDHSYANEFGLTFCSNLLLLRAGSSHDTAEFGAGEKGRDPVLQ